MAVDVPDSFIARNKTPPRYPPPRPPTQVIYTPNGSQKQPLLSTSSATSSLKSGSSSINGNGGIALDLQPPSFNNSTHVNNNHAIINTNHHSNNNHHMKNSTSSFDSCNEFNNKKSSSVKCPSSMGSVCESIGFDSMSYRTKSRGSLSTRSSSSGGEIGPPEYDLGPHREMAVDVPENFVGVTKMPPRYPKCGGGGSGGSNGTAANALQKSKESLTSTNSASTATEKDAIIPSTTNSQTINNITTPQTPNRNNEVFSFSFVLFYFCFMFSVSVFVFGSKLFMCFFSLSPFLRVLNYLVILLFIFTFCLAFVSILVSNLFGLAISFSVWVFSFVSRNIFIFLLL